MKPMKHCSVVSAIEYNAALIVPNGIEELFIRKDALTVYERTKF
jgi:hypothetical protein